MTALLILLGILTVIVAGAVSLFTIGTIGAVVVAIALIALVVYGIVAKGAVASIGLAVLGVVLVGALGFGGYSGYQLFSALTNTDGPTDPADPVALASGKAKLDRAEGQGGFAVTLTQDELTAILQDTLAEASDNPIKRVDLTITDGSGTGGTGSSNGAVEFQVAFKGSSITGSGRISARLEAGQIALDVQNVSLGALSLPGVATGAMEDIIETVFDLNERLAEVGADVQALEIGNDRVFVSGSQAGGELLTASSLLGALAENASSLAGSITPPEEQVAPGTANSTNVTGATYIVALGDSLAANVGVSSAREGYVSRVHRVLSERDGVQYGLRNFGVSGETSGTMIRSGQLGSALDFIRTNSVAYITIDIGANDLLGHLGDDDCSTSLQSPDCQARVAPALATYEANLERIMGDLRSAAGADTPIIFLLTYNPFSIGFGSAVSLEAASDEAMTELNRVAVHVAGDHGAVIADGASPMSGTTGATTSILQSPPDVHPNSAGYSILANAILMVLP